MTEKEKALTRINVEGSYRELICDDQDSEALRCCSWILGRGGHPVSPDAGYLKPSQLLEMYVVNGDEFDVRRENLVAEKSKKPRDLSSRKQVRVERNIYRGVKGNRFFVRSKYKYGGSFATLEEARACRDKLIDRRY